MRKENIQLCAAEGQLLTGVELHESRLIAVHIRHMAEDSALQLFAAEDIRCVGGIHHLRLVDVVAKDCIHPDLVSELGSKLFLRFFFAFCFLLFSPGRQISPAAKA